MDFSPPSPPSNVVPMFELPIENNKHPNNISTILSPIVVQPKCSEWAGLSYTV